MTQKLAEETQIVLLSLEAILEKQQRRVTIPPRTIYLAKFYAICINTAKPGKYKIHQTQIQKNKSTDLWEFIQFDSIVLSFTAAVYTKVHAIQVISFHQTRSNAVWQTLQYKSIKLLSTNLGVWLLWVCVGCFCLLLCGVWPAGVFPQL